MGFDDDWPPGRMMQGYHDGMYAGGWLMMLLTLLLIAALVTLAYLAFRGGLGSSGSAGRGAQPSAGSARDLLDQRLVRGEISPEDYRETRALLEG